MSWRFPKLNRYSEVKPWRTMEGFMPESDSDDDMPYPEFLNEAKTKVFEVLSPRKAIRPVHDTLSPLPSLGVSNCPKSKNKITIGSLLSEKVRTDFVEQNVSNILELKEKYQDEDYMDWVNNDIDNDSVLNCSLMSNSQDFDDSQDLPQQSSSQKEEFLGQENNPNNIEFKFGKLVNDFRDIYPGEKFFVRYCPEEDIVLPLKEVYCFVMDCEMADASDIFIVKDDNLSHTILQCILTIRKTLPENVCKCLFKVLTYGQDYKLSLCALQILTSCFLSDDVEPVWFPQVQDLVDSLKHYGADIEEILPSQVTSFLDINLQHNVHETIKSPLSPKSMRKYFNRKLHNFCGILKIMIVSLQYHCTKYSVKDINLFLIITMRLTLEKVVQTAVCELKVLIGSLLDAYDEESWEEEMEVVCNTIMLFNMHHRNLLKLVSTIPPTERGTTIRIVLSFNIASAIVYKSKSFRLSPTLTQIFHLISSITITTDVDYFELYSVLSLIFMCINTDNVNASEKKSYSNLIDRLHMLHGEIKECQGAYLDRTKVKDVILRMVSKLKYVVQNLQCQQSKLESYFGSHIQYNEDADSNDYSQ